jgi:VanZ family protein
MGVIFYWSNQSALPIDGLPNNDGFHKAGHVGEFAILALLLVLALGTHPRALLAAFAIAVVNGISDEFHQSFVPGRHAQVETIFLDSAVAAATLFVVWLASERLRRNIAAEDPAATGSRIRR